MIMICYFTTNFLITVPAATIYTPGATAVVAEVPTTAPARLHTTMGVSSSAPHTVITLSAAVMVISMAAASSMPVAGTAVTTGDTA